MSADKTITGAIRRRAMARSGSASLMNDTKWREVWEVLTALQLRFHIAFLGQPDWNAQNSLSLYGPFRSDFVLHRGIRDPGVGGPFDYQDILWIRVPRVYRNNVDEFLRQVGSLGQMPLFEGVDVVEVRGYQVFAEGP